MHTKSLFKFRDPLKLETLVDMDRRNVFCSLGYFKTWLLRLSLCRQTSKQAITKNDLILNSTPENRL